jgi:bacteriorhodopsin
MFYRLFIIAKSNRHHRSFFRYPADSMMVFFVCSIFSSIASVAYLSMALGEGKLKVRQAHLKSTSHSSTNRNQQ